ncbi:MAG: hypothetical protein JNL28_07915 [Planctomycetes bacterium]|nr:hypothetical protein [Planctomycetota bacterium]
MSHQHTHGGGGHGGYEPTDAHFGPIIKFLFWLFLATALVLVAMYGLIQLYMQMPVPNADVALHPLAAERQIPPEPRLEAQRGITKGVFGETSDETKEPYFNRKMFKQWNAEWKAELQSYQYIDEQIGLVRIPIERAMEMKLKQGFPTAKSRN